MTQDWSTFKNLTEQEREERTRVAREWLDGVKADAGMVEAYPEGIFAFCQVVGSREGGTPLDIFQWVMETGQSIEDLKKAL